MPVCRVGVPCDDAAARVTLFFSRAGRREARVTTAADGSYRVALAPGTYAVRTDQRGFLAVPKPRTATVPTGRYARVNFVLDTGIR